MILKTAYAQARMTIRHHPTPDQRELVAAFDRPLDALLPLARLHEGAGEAAQAWAGLADLGLFGVALPEDAGGAGLGAAEEVLLAERLGRRLAAPSVLATLVATRISPWAEAAAMADGSLRVAPAYRAGERIVVVDGEGADLLLLRDARGGALHRPPASDAGEPIGGLWVTTLRVAHDPGERIVTLDEVALLRSRLIDAAALAGIAGAALDMAVAYAKLREQFGRPIGSFQAVKHHCADMAMSARGAIDQATFAAVAIDDAREDASVQVEAALLLSIEAALGAAGLNIQVHGGIGFSEEAEPHLLLKRAHVHAAIAGGSEAATARLAAAPRAL